MTRQKCPTCKCERSLDAKFSRCVTCDAWCCDSGCRVPLAQPDPEATKQYRCRDCAKLKG